MLLFLRMKDILKSFFFSLIALFGASRMVKGFSYGGDPAVLAIAALAFGIINSYLKPILKLVTLPLYFLTLGFSSFLINTGLLYLTIKIVPELTVVGFRIPGLAVETQYIKLAVPVLDIPAFGTLLLASMVISLLIVILGLVLKVE